MKWEKLDSRGLKFEARCGGSSQVHQNKIFFFCGSRGQPAPSNIIFSYDFGKTLVQTNIELLGPKDQNVFEKFVIQGEPFDRIFPSSVLYRGSLVILGGYDSKAQLCNEIREIKLSFKKALVSIF